MFDEVKPAFKVMIYGPEHCHGTEEASRRMRIVIVRRDVGLFLVLKLRSTQIRGHIEYHMVAQTSLLADTHKPTSCCKIYQGRELTGETQNVSERHDTNPNKKDRETRHSPNMQ